MSRSPGSSKSPKSPRAKSPLFNRKPVCKEDCPGTTGPCNLIGSSPGEHKGDSHKKKATIQDPREKKKGIVSKCKAKCNKIYIGVGKKEPKPKGGKSFLPKKMVCKEDCKGTTGPCILLDRGAQSDTTKTPDRHAETSTSQQDTKIFFAEQGTPQPKKEKKKRKDRESPSSKSSDVSLKSSSSIISEGGKQKKRKEKRKGRGEGVSPRASKTSTSSKESIKEKKEKKKKREPKPSESGSTTIVVPQTPVASSTPSHPSSAEEPGRSGKKKPRKSSSSQLSQQSSTDDATKSPAGTPKRAKQKSPKEPKEKKKVKGG